MYYKALERLIDGSLHRNLHITNEILVKSPPSDMILATYIQQGKSVDEAWIKHSGGANLKGRNYKNASINWAKLYRAQLEGAQLQGAFFADTDLQGANFSRAELQDAHLSFSNLQDSILVLAKLQGASLSFTELQGANLTLTELQNASLNWADLRGATLILAELQGADLSKAKLHGANLSGAELQGADLSEAKLQGAVLSEAKLQGANLSGAELQGANLSGAKLQGANLSGALFFQTIIDYSLLDWSDWNSAKVAPPDIKEGDKGPFTRPLSIEALTHVRHDGIFGKGNNPALFDEKQAQWIVENVFCKEFYTRSSILERSSDHLLQKIFEAMDHDPSCKEIPSDVPEISRKKFIKSLEDAKSRMKELGSVRSQPGRK